MRPDRAVVIQAIRDEEGKMSRVALRLGCSRQTLYTWVYQYGLEKLAGIRIDIRDGLDKRKSKDTKDTQPRKPFNTTVQSADEKASTLSDVATQVAAEREIPVTIKLPESLWKRVKTNGIWSGRRVSEIVQEAIEDKLNAADGPATKNGKKNSGGDR